MDGQGLIRQARKAGLKVEAVADRLIIRGPQSAKKLAKAILTRKSEIVELLRSEEGLRSKTKSLVVKPGDSVEWQSPRFGQRYGRVAAVLGGGWFLARSHAVPSNLTLVHIIHVTELKSGAVVMR